jgi:hypothetical protein
MFIFTSFKDVSIAMKQSQKWMFNSVRSMNQCQINTFNLYCLIFSSVVLMTSAPCHDLYFFLTLHLVSLCGFQGYSIDSSFMPSFFITYLARDFGKSYLISMEDGEELLWSKAHISNFRCV